MLSTDVMRISSPNVMLPHQMRCCALRVNAASSSSTRVVRTRSRRGSRVKVPRSQVRYLRENKADKKCSLIVYSTNLDYRNEMRS